MALIYASAVNKRMNSHAAPKCKRSVVESPHCGLQDIINGRHRSNDDTDITDMTDMTRSISLNKEISARRKRSVSQLSNSTLLSTPPTNKNNNSFFFPMSTSLLYSSKLSRTKPTRKSCSEIKRKTTVPNGPQVTANTRKISTPVMMMHSSMSPSNEGSKDKAKANMRKNMVKKRLIQEYGLEPTVDIGSSSRCHNISLDDNGFNDRRKSQSLDPDDWQRQVALASGEEDDDETSPRNNERKKSAFQKMRNKLAKWRIS
jgi:hypothetical protein